MIFVNTIFSFNVEIIIVNNHIEIDPLIQGEFDWGFYLEKGNASEANYRW